MTTAINRRIAKLEQAAADERPEAPVKVFLLQDGEEPEPDENGERYGPGRIVIRLVNL